MKLPAVFQSIFFFLCLAGAVPVHAQRLELDSATRKKLSLGKFCLCQTTVDDLYALSSDFTEVTVEEMDTPVKCYAHDGRYVNGKGFYSKKYPGIILQEGGPGISKIRITKDYKGNLPDGSPVDMKNMLLKDVFKLYPALRDKWGSRGCSDYWSFSNDTLSFYVKIDTSKKPQFPIDEAYYMNKPVEAIDFVTSCYNLITRNDPPLVKLSRGPLFFVDSIRVQKETLDQIYPNDVAMIEVLKDSNAVRVAGPEGINGVVYITTKKSARSRYWNFFSSRSAAYAQAVPTPEADTAFVYVLNEKVLTGNDIEYNLAGVNAGVFIDLQVISAETLNRQYGLEGTRRGVVIKTKVTGKK